LIVFVTSLITSLFLIYLLNLLYDYDKNIVKNKDSQSGSLNAKDKGKGKFIPEGHVQEEHEIEDEDTNINKNLKVQDIKINTN
jgi:hypothetical protein